LTAQVISDITERRSSKSKSRTITRELGKVGDFAKTRRKRGPDAVSAGATLRRGRGDVPSHERRTGAELGVRRGVAAGVFLRDGTLLRNA